MENKQVPLVMEEVSDPGELAKARCEDIRRECEQRALIESASSEASAPFYAGALVSVGKILVEVGSRLQAQYAYDEEQHSTRSALDTGAAAS